MVRDNISSCIICENVDNDRMVQCDTCDRWCHYDCAKVGDEIQDLSWNCISCAPAKVNASSRTLGTPEGSSSPRGAYGTPLEQRSDANTTEMQHVNDGQLNLFGRTQCTMPSIPAAVAVAGLLPISSTNVTPFVENNTYHNDARKSPFYTLAATTNASCDRQVPTCSTVTHTLYNNNNNNQTLFNKQAASCTETSTAFDNVLNLNSRYATLFRQNMPQSACTSNQRIDDWQHFRVNNQQQNKTQHVSFENRYVDNTIANHQRTLELQMLEEEQKLKERYLQKKYEILQQFGDGQNNFQQFGDGHNNQQGKLNENRSVTNSRPTQQQLASRHILPKELPSFYGDPEEWPIFISSFENSTEVGGYSNAENLIRLQHCLKGKAREMVRNKLLLPNMVPEILRTLKMYFGRPELIVERLIDKARQLPPPRDKLDAIIDFAMCVRNICSTIEACKMDAHLNNPMLVKELVDKLSNNYKLQWAMQPKPNGLPTLIIFSDWLYTIAEAASQFTTPVFSKKSGVINTHTEVDKTTTEQKCFVCNITGHKVSECSTFKKLPIDEKWSIIREKRICNRCLKIHHRRCYVNRDCGVGGCKAKHHPQLHNINRSATVNSNVIVKHISTADVNSHYDQENATLFRIIPIRIHAGDKYVDTYAFLDEGSSITLVEEEIFDSLNMHGVKESLCLKWTSGTTRVEESSYRTSFDISSLQNNSKYRLQGVRTVKNLSLPKQSIDEAHMKAKYPHLSTIPIQSYRNAKPTILIGGDNWSLAVPQKICEGPWNQPIATKTRLGWAVQGVSSANKQNHQVNIHLCECKRNLDSVHEAVKQMFALESSAVRTIQSADDEKAIHILESTCKYMDGQFELGLPWRNDEVALPNSYDTAYKRSICLQRKIEKDVDLKIKIEKEIKNLIDKGYARKLTTDEIATEEPHTWYLPIFVTINPNKPNRVRLVWDAAAKTNGSSLNDFLLCGPDLLISLIDVLLAFRIGRIAICGDIAEMFHQILLRQKDIHAQKFLWWNEDDVETPSVYIMGVLSFGLNCAPCMAHFVRNKNADRFENLHPRAVEAIKEHHYVDDLIESVDSEEDAIKLAEEVRKIHAAGGFTIRNWASNSTKVLDQLCGNGTITQSPKELGSTEKILGVHWDPAEDNFKFVYKFPRIKRNILNEQIIPTKREILKVLMSIYDPLGFVSCYTIGLKILLQEIWRSGINWDQELPNDLIIKWQQWKSNLPLITSMEIPRCYSPRLQSSENVQLHTFVDAGELGYAAISYLRIECNANVSVVMVMAKSKVAPLKPISIPRLELQAAVLGIRLALKIVNVKRIPINSRFWWSDSKTVLKWLRMDPRKLQQFVMHRVGEILDNSEVHQWKWIPSKCNPADLATKIITKPDSTLWLNGPDFLSTDETTWPQCDDLGPTDTTEVRSQYLQLHTMVPTKEINVKYFSDWKRCYRALATFFLYMEKLKDKAKNRMIPREVTFDMICKSKIALYKKAQSDVYADEICCLKLGKNITRNSSLISLNIFLDDDGLVKVRGRTEHLSCHRDVIVLPKDHDITFLIVQYAHERHHHVSHETVINNLKSQYYIPKLRVLYRKVRNKCQKCKNEAASPRIPQMASLPPARVGAFERPFTYTGIDYFGPITVTFGRRSEKRWGVIFTCLTTRAIHIEVAHSLDTGSCVMCLRNFIGRRGYPRQIYTDNGTNFKATEKVLREELHKLDDAVLVKTFDEIKWFFNPPAAPHMGGAWERLVRSVKTVLHSAHPKSNFNDETLRSALIEVEFMINSRPLTFVSLESCDDEAITPNHLLIGSSTGYKPICSENLNLRRRWYQTQAFADQFWRRWVKEYTPMITRRSKWFIKQLPINVGDVVLIVDECQPRNCWLKGIIIETILAKDGQVRRAIVKTANGVLQRPVSKLAVLDVGSPEGKLGEMSPAYGGGNVTADAMITGAVN